MDKVNVQEVVDKIMEIIAKSNEREFTTAMLCKNVLGDDFDLSNNDPLMEIHYKLIEELEKNNLEMEYTDDGIVGLPYNISYIVKSKD